LRWNGAFASDATMTLARLRATPHDLMIVAAYGLLLPQPVLDIAVHGCLNIHASLLPRWRGAAPIARALEAGDTETGITLMQMDAGLDTGPILSQASIAIAASDTTATLTEKLAILGAQQIIAALDALEQSGALAAAPQPATGATYAKKIDKREALLDWRRSAEALARQMRALDPFPGAVAMLNHTPLKLWAAIPVALPMRAQPGQIIDVTANSVTIACGAGALRVTQWQRPGGKRLAAREFVAGFPLRAGQCFTMLNQTLA
jgi:methionyl-tRNA formyltransferase